MYSIFILHQTTTTSVLTLKLCILYSIFILHQTTTSIPVYRQGRVLYSIFILHQTTTHHGISVVIMNCILSLFYIKPQLKLDATDFGQNCILSLFYIKPQLYLHGAVGVDIVFYLYSTSNHNQSLNDYGYPELYSIFILHQTTTETTSFSLQLKLYSIFILHQTTTFEHYQRPCYKLYSIFILHQTTTLFHCSFRFRWLYSIFILHQTTTGTDPKQLQRLLYSIFILHQTTTTAPTTFLISYCILSLFYIKPQPGRTQMSNRYNCILSLFYIKPQPRGRVNELSKIVFYLYSTSNHNDSMRQGRKTRLYSIFILHQTTTTADGGSTPPSLYSIFILHQTTTISCLQIFTHKLYSIFILHQTTTLTTPHFSAL